MERRDPLDMHDLIRRHQAGESVNQLAVETGLHWQTIAKRLTEAGHEIRRGVQVGEAHRARRGSVDSPATQHQRALTRQRRGLGSSDYERQLAALLTERQVKFTPQLAVGPYNVDLALDEAPVAVELRGGGYNARTRAGRRQRLEHLLGAGFYVLELLIRYGRVCKVSAATAEEVIAFAQLVSGDPAPARRHRVVWADGQPYTGRRLELHQWPSPASTDSAA